MRSTGSSNRSSGTSCDGPGGHRSTSRAKALLTGVAARPVGRAKSDALPAAHADPSDDPASTPARLQAPSPVARLVLLALRAYKILLSPLFAGSCRFTPSCSDYMAEAVRRHGAVRGGWLGLARLARCHPFGAHGLDPVP